MRAFSTTPMKHRIGLYAGSFDPPSVGHLDIIQRACTLCDKLYVGIGINPQKKPVFSHDQRMDLLYKITRNLGHEVEPILIEGLTADFIQENDVNFLIRGIRSHSDLDSEIIMAIMNRKISGVETVMLMAEEGKVHISSTMIRTLGKYKKKLHNFVPAEI
eukprot:CAMPEP_0205802344 /NCGR_PEP_ID=MMETSP0205-20121125/4625_1 /ASSEMBLY_ACC=CAM_ASM_000278 /TAXON_ID=36767 /ORGANISM="Euplotes focardii, Strain TN1" /LENGTH=159 /DNA_ID=CAMNT_0053068583 /DNA_START=57 /DNA_END=533 /DNA_ORIENTATION=-